MMWHKLRYIGNSSKWDRSDKLKDLKVTQIWPKGSQISFLPQMTLLLVSELSRTSFPLISVQVRSQPQKKDLKDFLLRHQVTQASRHVSIRRHCLWVVQPRDTVYLDLMLRRRSLGASGRHMRVILQLPCHCSLISTRKLGKWVSSHCLK